MGDDNAKFVATDKDESQDNTNEVKIEENESCKEESACNIFNYKRPTAEDAKKTKRKTCC